MSGDTMPDSSRDFAYGIVSPGVVQTLEHRLNTMSEEEEGVLIARYLQPIRDLEEAVLSASENLDTDVAAVWTRNKNEVSDRRSLFKMKCIDMCEFLGIRHGKQQQNGLRVVRG